MDREFAEVLYRALRMIVAYLEKRYSLGKSAPAGDYDMVARDL